MYVQDMFAVSTSMHIVEVSVLRTSASIIGLCHFALDHVVEYCSATCFLQAD